jgi:uroporphyrinogen-III synthase
MLTTGCEAQMQRQIPAGDKTLRGRTVVITRPAGTAVAMVRQVRLLGGIPLMLPGLSLRRLPSTTSAQAGLRAALEDDLVIFASPAAVRFAAALLPLRTAATVMAVGDATAQVLRRHGVAAPVVPVSQDSEGLLAHPLLQDLDGVRVALIGAPGGRGLLRAQLVARGARFREVHVYQRSPPRLDRRHFDALLTLPCSARVLLSSVEALDHLSRLLPPPSMRRLLAATAVASSVRLAEAARASGFARIVPAVSALAADMLDAAARAD